MNNKQKGMRFERRMQEVFTKAGWWVHFISPDHRGAQPFDMIVVRNGDARVFDCKTCDSHIFSIDRLEDNQVLAFERWIRCGNSVPYIVVEHDSKVYFVSYDKLKAEKRVDLDKLEVDIWLTDE